MTERTRLRVLLVAIVIAACFLDIWASRLLEETGFSPIQRFWIAMIPLPGEIALIAMVLYIVRFLDEFKRQVGLEAVTFAFLTTGVGVFVYGYVQKAGLVGPFHAAWIWIFMLVTYGLGHLIAMWRYR
ncbi:hypothetical protein FTW19_09180 [Terriglobus albidus]|uniref:Uncharacterized protein n=1 Tax=Terriglobus albidus TaxID=1592106 RepID=A0A5B9ECG2_9BACT|nr:hypothetical protein [Terriglobus albidus]QEE28151.1 hypothetical protein FTW19_09180 [Terriglobus albidus]